MLQFIYVVYDDYSYQSAPRQTFITKMIDFIFDKDNTFENDINDEITGITAEQDRIMRICCATYHFHKNGICENKKLHNYLETKATSSNKFYTISIQNMVDHCDDEKTTGVTFFDRVFHHFRTIIKDDVKGRDKLKEKLNDPSYVAYDWEQISKWGLFLKQLAICTICTFIFVLIPLWCVTRLFYLSFPVISMVNEMKYYVKNSDDGKFSWNLMWNIVNSNEIVLLQVILTGIYWFLVLTWIVYLVKVMNFYFWVKLVGLGNNYWSLWDVQQTKVYNDITEQYQTMYDSLVVKEVLCEFFGDDLGSIIFDYWININIDKSKIVK